MPQYVSEAFVAIAHPPSIAEKICMHIRDFFGPIINDGADRLLDFDEGRAIIRSTEDGLLFWASARDLATFYGIRTLLEGALLEFAPVSARAIEWLPADGIPFRGIGKCSPNDDRMKCS